jgi:two-component system nitrate/nitrite response regulator NarL
LSKQLIRTVVISEVRFYRECLSRVLSDDAEIEVSGIASHCAESLKEIAALEPDVVVLDLTQQQGEEAIRPLTAAAPHVKIVAAVTPEIEHEIIGWIEAGIAGYATPEKLVASIKGAVRDEFICSPRVADTLRRCVAAAARESRLPDYMSELTPRELEVVTLITDGLSNKEIASRLSIEVPTVKNHVHNILEKLGVACRSAAAAKIQANYSIGQVRTPKGLQN